MKKQSDFNITYTGLKNYAYRLTMSTRVKNILKKYCHYQTFAFLYKTEREALNDIESIKSEIRLKYLKAKDIVFTYNY